MVILHVEDVFNNLMAILKVNPKTDIKDMPVENMQKAVNSLCYSSSDVPYLLPAGLEWTSICSVQIKASR